MCLVIGTTGTCETANGLKSGISVLCSPRSPNKPRECTGKCRQFNGFGLVQTGSGPGGRWFKIHSPRPILFGSNNLPHKNKVGARPRRSLL